MLIMRFRWRQLGGHVHVRVFTGKQFDGTFEKCGDLVFDGSAWPLVARRLGELAVLEDDGACVQVKHEDEA